MSGTFVTASGCDGPRAHSRVRREVDRAIAGARLPALTWLSESGLEVGLGVDVAGLGTGPGFARTQSLAVVGNVRLDEREDLLRGLRLTPDGKPSDLEVVATFLEANGTECFRDIVGEFALVIWNRRTRELTAARDALGVCALYHRSHGGLDMFSSRVSALVHEERYDDEYLLDFVLGNMPGADRTAFAGISAVEPGCMITPVGGLLRTVRYWSPHDALAAEQLQPEDAVGEFRSLFLRAVQLRMTGNGTAWAQLSGGLDSSSIVCAAQHLAECGGHGSGLGGTVTIADSLGSGDERQFSAAVLARFPLPNLVVWNARMWEDDGSPPPVTDGPTPQFPFFYRDRRIWSGVSSAGGRVVLSGLGADHYLSSSPYGLADRWVQGKIREVLVDLTRLARQRRTSFWNLAFDSVLLPLAPLTGRRLALKLRYPVPSWITLIRTPGRDPWRNSSAARLLEGGVGEKLMAARSYQVAILGQSVDRSEMSDRVEIRYPFLYRPLVELGLNVAKKRRSTTEGKWLLREGMRGVLPEIVRSRKGKGAVTGRLDWALRNQPSVLANLLSEPMLASLGWLNHTVLRRAIEAERVWNPYERGCVTRALALETWMRAR